MRMYRLLAAAAALLCAFSLTACSPTDFSVEALMDAPVPTPEQAEIRNALLAGLGVQSVKLKYPKAGEYRSAFILHDLDGDGQDEALCFYDLDMEGADTQFSVLNKSDGAWRIEAGQAGQGVNVDSVSFADMLPNGGECIVVGWTQANGEHEVGVYTYADGQISPEYQRGYDEMLLYDINADGLAELLLLDGKQVTLAGAKTKSVPEDRKRIDRLTSLSFVKQTVNSFLKIQIGMLNEDSEAIFIDTDDGEGNYNTNIVRYDESTGKLVDVVRQIAGEERPSFERRIKIFCEDIDGDGVMEVPYAPDDSRLPGYETLDSEDGEIKYFTRYLRYGEDRFDPVWQGAVNVRSGYRFAFPDDWVGAVTVANDTVGQNSWRFIVFDKNLQQDTRVLLRVTVTSPNEPKDQFATQVENERFLAKRGIYEYRAFIPEGLETEPLRIDYKTAEERFSVLP